MLINHSVGRELGSAAILIGLVSADAASLVAENDAAVGKVGQQHCRAVGVMGLAGGQRQLDWQATGSPKPSCHALLSKLTVCDSLNNRA